MSNKLGKTGILTFIGILVALLAWQFPVGFTSSPVVYVQNNISQSVRNNGSEEYDGYQINEYNNTEEKVINRSEIVSLNNIQSADFGFFSNSNESQLMVSGSGISIAIKESISGVAYKGGNLSGSNSKSIVYLPKGQLLLVKVTGSGVDIEIQKSIAEFVRVNDYGSGTNVSEI